MLTDIGGTPVVQSYGNNEGNGMFGGNGLFGGFLLGALLTGRNGLFGGNNGNVTADGVINANGNIFTGFLDMSKSQADLRYEVATDTLSQTIALQPQIADVKYENAINTLTQSNQINNSFANIDRGILDSKYQLTLQNAQIGNVVAQSELALSSQIKDGNALNNLAITKMGYDNIISNLNSTNALQKSIDNCCCQTNLRMTELDYQGQLRDAENFAKLSNGQTEIKCLITDTAKQQEINALRGVINSLEKENERMWDKSIAGRTNCLVTSLGDAARAQFGQTFPWNIPACGC